MSNLPKLKHSDPVHGFFYHDLFTVSTFPEGAGEMIDKEQPAPAAHDRLQL
jgi:hypothetical protein